MTLYTTPRDNLTFQYVFPSWLQALRENPIVNKMLVLMQMQMATGLVSGRYARIYPPKVHPSHIFVGRAENSNRAHPSLCQN